MCHDQLFPDPNPCVWDRVSYSIKKMNVYLGERAHEQIKPACYECK